MERVAVLVDAGHLFAQGSAAISGDGSKARHLIQIDAPKAIAAFQQHCSLHASGCSLLRIYWYDGVGSRGPTRDHDLLASCDNLKLRLGFINSQGQQKGVDSLIVTDLIELARNKAITDAVFMAGDEDLRIGVQVAQSYGVRVHLIGIVPIRSSQSKQLRQEADTTHEWSKETVESFLTIVPSLSTVAPIDSTSPVQITPSKVKVPVREPGQQTPSIEQCVNDFAAALNATDLTMIKEYYREKQQVPQHVDRKLLATTRDRLERNLTAVERKTMREVFFHTISTRAE